MGVCKIESKSDASAEPGIHYIYSILRDRSCRFRLTKRLIKNMPKSVFLPHTLSHHLKDLHKNNLQS